MSTIVKYAEDILSAAKALEANFQSNNLPDPTFENGAIDSLPSSLQEHRKTLINKTDQLNRLVWGVQGYTNVLIHSRAHEVTLRAVYKYKVANHVPLEGSASYESLATATGLSVQLLQRFLRHCMGNFIFAQTPEGRVRHTAFSRRLATDPDFADALGMALEEVGPATGFVLEAIQRFGESGEQNETGFAMLNQAVAQKDGTLGPLLSIFGVLGQNPERGRRFGTAMRFYSKGATQALEYLLNGFDWASLDKPGSVLVDVGGGIGSVSQFLARHTQNLRFVVQDSADTVQNGEKSLPADMKDRVQYEARDFFQPQERVADAYFMRWILHNWSDKYAVKILQSLIPVLKNGSRVILFEHLIPSEPETLISEKHGPCVILCPDHVEVH